MHELSLAHEILKIAEKTASDAGAHLITRIDIDVGSLAGIMVGALEFGLDVSKKGTLAESAIIDINTIVGAGTCPTCGETFPVNSIFAKCPDCPAAYLRINSGTEFKVIAIEVEDANYV
jgi:hydrogenase nickel incorporation protein HypA/HybF